jgi:hypothetical protein
MPRRTIDSKQSRYSIIQSSMFEFEVLFDLLSKSFSKNTNTVLLFGGGSTQYVDCCMLRIDDNWLRFDPQRTNEVNAKIKQLKASRYLRREPGCLIRLL